MKSNFPLPSFVLVLLIAGAIWATTLVQLRGQYRDDTIAAERETANLARGLAEHVNRTIEGVDQIMLLLRAAYAHNPETLDLAGWASASIFSNELTLRITLVDADGIVISTNLGPIASRVDLADRAHIRAQLDSAEDKLLIGAPLLGRVSGRWSIQFTRKLFSRAGAVAGVVVVSLDPQYLSRFYQSIDIGGGAILLAGQDGVIRARAPGEGEHVGRRLDGATMEQLGRTAPAGSYRAASPLDGVERIYSYRWLAGYPLVLVVGQATSDIFAAHEAASPRYVAAACALTMLVIVVAGVLNQQRRRLLHARAQLDATLESISQGVLMIDGDGRVPVLNGRAAELLGLPAALARPNVPLEDILAWEADRPEETGAEPHEHTRPNGVVLEVCCRKLAQGGAVRIYTDVTERRQVERALAAARDAAEAGDRARTEFLALLRHEIRTSMNGMVGTAGLLLDSRLTDEQRLHAETLQDAAANMMRTLDDALAVSKFQQDSPEPEHAGLSADAEAGMGA